MKIKQAFVGATFFRDRFLQKFSLRPYDNQRLPAVFFGCYYNQVPLVEKHQTPAIVVWIGSDALHASKFPDRYYKVLRSPLLRHIATSDMISKTLSTLRVLHVVLPITPYTSKEFKPQPMGDSIYFYNPDKNPALYGRPWFEKALAAMPKPLPKFVEIRERTYQPFEMPGVYAKCFCNLRLTSHDGISTTVVEMALMGRHSLYNNSSPGATPWKNEQDIIDFIVREGQREKPDLLLREEMLSYINIPETWLEI